MNLEEFSDFKIMKKEVGRLMGEGWRLVQILAQKAPPLVPGVPSVTGMPAAPVQTGSSVPSSEAVEMTYSFAKEKEFCNLRATAYVNQVIPSISDLCIGSFLYENEIHELFGVKIEGIAIDYKGTLYQTAEKQAFNPEVVRG